MACGTYQKMGILSSILVIFGENRENPPLFPLEQARFSPYAIDHVRSARSTSKAHGSVDS